MSKLVNNTYRDYQFAFANFVALVSDKFSLDPYEIITTCNDDYSRASIPSPGLVGGSCLEKDPYILSASLKNKDKILSNEDFIWSRRINDKFFLNLLLKFKSLTNLKNLNIGILGGAFKAYPETDDIRGSFIFNIIDWFKLNYINPNIEVYDSISSKYHPGLKFWAKDMNNLIKKSNIVVIQTNNAEFFSENVINILNESKEQKYIIDYWGVFNKHKKRINDNNILINYGLKDD